MSSIFNCYERWPLPPLATTSLHPCVKIFLPVCYDGIYLSLNSLSLSLLFLPSFRLILHKSNQFMLPKAPGDDRKVVAIPPRQMRSTTPIKTLLNTNAPNLPQPPTVRTALLGPARCPRCAPTPATRILRKTRMMRA